MVDAARLTRQQIAKAVGNDSQTIRAFERSLSGARVVRTAAADTFISAADNIVVLTAAATATLPLAGDIVGASYSIKRMGVSATVAAQPGELIDGAATYVIGLLNESITVVSTGTAWVVV